MTFWHAYKNTVVSPNDGHIVARNNKRKETDILGISVHQVGFIYKTLKKMFGQLGPGRNFERRSSEKRNTRSEK
jgi:hypothetical protein